MPETTQAEKCARRAGPRWLVCVLVAGCGSVPFTHDAGLDEVPPSTTSAATVKVTLNWVDDTGQVSSTQDVTSLVLRGAVARVPSTAPGGFESHTAEMTASGLEIRDLPDGTAYDLDLDSLFGRLVYVTDLRDVDLKFYAVGRRAPAQPTKPTPLTLHVTNMTPWVDGDRLALSCDHVAASATLDASQSFVSGWPAVGARQLDLTVDWAQVDHGLFQDRMTPLIDGAQGDLLTIAHIRRNASSTGYVYDAPIETFTFAPFTQRDGVARSLDGAFTTQPRDTVHFNLKRPEFARYASDVHPTGSIIELPFGGGGVGIRTQPGDPDHRHLFSPFGPGLLFTLFNPSATDTLEMGQMSFPRPPANWSEWLAVSHNFQVMRDTPLGIPQTVIATINVSRPIMPGSAPGDTTTAITPRISPPKNPMLDGTPFSTPHLALLQPAGPAIQVTWDEPSLIDAPPTSYALNIVQLTKSGDQLATSPVATIFSPAGQRSLSIPWALFPGRGYYYFVLTAAADEGVYNPKLDDIGPSDSTADTVSGILTLN